MLIEICDQVFANPYPGATRRIHPQNYVDHRFYLPKRLPTMLVPWNTIPLPQSVCGDEMCWLIGVYPLPAKGGDGKKAYVDLDPPQHH